MHKYLFNEGLICLESKLNRKVENQIRQTGKLPVCGGLRDLSPARNLVEQYNRVDSVEEYIR